MDDLLRIACQANAFVLALSLLASNLRNLLVRMHALRDEAIRFRRRAR